jgi:uncharacterized membrane protein
MPFWAGLLIVLCGVGMFCLMLGFVMASGSLSKLDYDEIDRAAIKKAAEQAFARRVARRTVERHQPDDPQEAA